ncbi:biopolymer transporter ExbD [Candidatus Sumerlaeota bacterium]|nr:biopolymer transporter ExbD [Candidatus Sumerlaeota bacterium]
MRRRSSSLQPISSISLTSMMDVTFNLLIAFMIVAPTLKHGIKLELPKIAASNLKPKNSVVIVIRNAPEKGEEERIYVDDKRTSPEELGEIISALYEKNPELDILIEADKTIPYEIIARVLYTVQKAGVEGVGLVTEPAPK